MTVKCTSIDQATHARDAAAAGGGRAPAHHSGHNQTHYGAVWHMCAREQVRVHGSDWLHVRSRTIFYGFVLNMAASVGTSVYIVVENVFVGSPQKSYTMNYSMRGKEFPPSRTHSVNCSGLSHPDTSAAMVAEVPCNLTPPPSAPWLGSR